MRLIWLDLETSGLNPSKHAILEVAVGFADLSVPFELKTMDPFVLRFDDVHTHGVECKEPGAVVVGLGTDDGPCPACSFAPEARAMHAKNGLLAECRTSTTTVGEVEDYLLTLVHGEPERGDDKPTLAGSTVHFDLGFLRAHAPRFAARLSHRCYDVSAVKLFCESLGMPRIPKGNAHRAVDDVMESIQHAKRCAEWLRAHLGPSAISDEDLERFLPPALRSPTKPPSNPPAEASRVHILYAGHALCGLSNEVPAKWPPGHRWVSYQEKDALDLSDCDACKANFKVEQRRPEWTPAPAYVLPGEEWKGPQGGPIAEPDAHCATTPDGGCSSTDAACMHQPKG